MALYIHAWLTNFQKKTDLSLLKQEKNSIFQSFVKPKLQQEFSDRLKFAFAGSNATEAEILRFLSNTSETSNGFLQKLEQEYNAGCQKYFSQPPDILYQNIPATSHKELAKRMQIEQNMVNHAAKVASRAKEYAMAVLQSEGKTSAEIDRILNFKSVQNGRPMGLKSVQRCSTAAQQAIKEYSKAAMCANNLQAHIPGNPIGSHSSFAETAREMRSLMGELTSSSAVREIGKVEGQIYNAMWGGSLKGGSLSKMSSISGKTGSLVITKNTEIDPKWAADIEKNNQDWKKRNKNYTLKEDSMVYVKEGEIQGFYGISVKDYTGLNQENPWIAIDTFGGSAKANIKTALARAAMNGMPTNLANLNTLYNLAIAQYGKEGEAATMEYWTNFIDTIVMFNALDSLMGRKQGKGHFSYGMNNMFMIINGQVLFMKDIVDRLTGETFAAATGFGENKFNSYRKAAEMVNHLVWKTGIFDSGEARSDYLKQNIVPQLLQIQLQTKIDISKLGLYSF